MPAAEASYRQAIAAKADYALCATALAVLLQRQGRLEEAVACYCQSLSIEPDQAVTHCNLASALKDLDRPTEALQSYARALELDPNLAEAHFNRAVIYQSQQRTAEAEACYRHAIRARPGYIAALSNLGTVCKSLGRLDEAMDCYNQALAVDNSLAEPHRNRALLRLLMGNYAEGWPEYEWRRHVPGLRRTEFVQPQWQGQPIAGSTLLLFAEQGLGDTLQFVRYAAMVKARSAAKVLFHCPPRLHAILSTVTGIDHLLAGPVSEPIDYALPLLSAPAVLGTTLANIPADVPYLAADAERIAQWRNELADTADFKIGITWQGNPAYEDDPRRSVPLAAFAPLADCANVRLFSLQKEHGLSALAELAERLRIVDLGPRSTRTKMRLSIRRPS